MIEIADRPFVASEFLARFEDGEQGEGAIVSFVGKVRAAAKNDTVTALVLEHYPGVTERSIQKIEDEALSRWAINRVAIIHRVGKLLPGEAIVMVCVSSAHRRDAFEAADFLMDYLKTEAMFWKKEIRANGQSWIEPRSDDYNDAARWKKGK
ncbi:molybdenum cofactor biosynthesis protein MoaE [Hyphococcus sp. DH-69]|uniref:molybdenum cofactor biosynthesis protein MoaE n=1 Tax=Hyphococcus formosus TaxID=3143534 RepID=UPI00398B0309